MLGRSELQWGGLAPNASFTANPAAPTKANRRLTQVGRPAGTETPPTAIKTAEARTINDCCPSLSPGFVPADSGGPDSAVGIIDAET